MVCRQGSVVHDVIVPVSWTRGTTAPAARSIARIVAVDVVASDRARHRAPGHCSDDDPAHRSVPDERRRRRRPLLQVEHASFSSAIRGVTDFEVLRQVGHKSEFSHGLSMYFDDDAVRHLPRSSGPSRVRQRRVAAQRGRLPRTRLRSEIGHDLFDHGRTTVYVRKYDAEVVLPDTDRPVMSIAGRTHPHPRSRGGAGPSSWTSSGSSGWRTARCAGRREILARS